MDENVGKLGGSSGGEDEEFSWYLYYFWLPFLIFARTAQYVFSCGNFLFGLLFGDAVAYATFLCFLWQAYLFGCGICMECFAIFQWLIWIHTYFGLRFLSQIVGMPFVVLKSVWLEHTFTGSIQNYSKSLFTVYDERLFILSSVRIYADWVYIFCSTYIGWHIWLYRLTDFKILMFNFYKQLLIEKKPPWTKSLSCGIAIMSIFLVTCQCCWSSSKVFFEVLQYKWNFGHFHDVQQFSVQPGPYFFDCIDVSQYDIPQIPAEATNLICLPCQGDQEDLASTPIKLPEYQSTFLAAFQHNENKGVYTTFDPDTEYCVVDNCANVHIWNDFSAFIPSSYLKFNAAVSTSVSAVNGDSNLPAGCGDVPVAWKDDNGKEYDIVLKNVLHFPKSPVKILSVVSLSEQLQDDLNTWILTRRRQSIFTWAFGKFTKTIIHGKSRLPELSVKSTHSSTDAFFSLVKKSKTANCHLIFGKAFKVDRSAMAAIENLDSESIPCFFPSSHHAYAVETENSSDDPISSETVLPPIPTLSIGSSVRYIKDDHVEVGTLVGVDMSNPSVPTMFDIEFKDGRKVQATRENLELSETPDAFDIPTKARTIIEVAASMSKKNLHALMNPEVLTPLQQLWIWWHEVLDHLPRVRMNRLVEKGSLPSKFKILKDWHFVCASCLLSQQRRTSWRSKRKPSSIAKDNVKAPGDMVCIDQIISAQPGLLPRISGRHTRERISAAVIFKDVFSSYTYVHLMTSCDLDQTINAKVAFEKIAASYGVSVKHYHADNGTFACKGFRDAVSAANQKITFCGVGAHHQNGIVENMIGLLTRSSRTNLLHAKQRWPQAISTILWPYALKAACATYNELHLDENGASPDSKFASVNCAPVLSNRHPWGCPVFVLNQKAQGGMAPKWEPRSRVGIYLGHSPTHAGSVAMVLNPRTLHVSPQYHVVFDDNFSTVASMVNGEVPENWEQLVNQSDQILDPAGNDLTKLWASQHFDPFHDDDEVPDPENADNFGTPKSSNVTPENELLMPTMPDLDELTCRRSTRTRAAPDFYDPSALQSTVTCKPMSTSLSILFSMVCLTATGSIFETPACASLFSNVLHQTHLINQHFDGTLNYISPLAFTADSSDNDTYTFKQMLQQPDKNEFILAMMKEVQDHENRSHWHLVPRSSLPTDKKTILSIWSFKRKRFPDGRIMKYKARLCAHGGMQQWGVDYWETYAPVVNWLCVRALLILSVIHGYHSRSIDFVLAFPQAKLEEDVFMEFPAGVEYPGGSRKQFVLKLDKNLYGLKNAAHNWFQMLSSGLQSKKLNFQSSAIDPCVFFRKDAILLTWVDDCIIFSKDLSTINSIVKTLQEDFDVELEDDLKGGDVSRYLGMEIQRNTDKSFEIKQPFLIDRILSLLEIDDKVNPKNTPVSKPLLHKDKEAAPRARSWNYRAVIGMLNYLQASTRPDIAMAVHQCARFSIDPRITHERAVMRIGKYLLATKERGIKFTPDTSKGVECHVDADFAGSWDQADSGNPENVLSRTGYIISIYGCPVTWTSKLQTEIALSTAEAEYIALSQSTREIIPLMNLLKELNLTLNFGMKEKDFQCTLYEDNTSCITIAGTQKFTPRTKHISLKYHWFRSFTKGPNKLLDIKYINTREQTADILTKPLDEPLFTYLRRKSNGW